MRPMTRRNALILGGVGIAGVAVGGTGLLMNQGAPSLSPSDIDAGGEFIEPTELRSAGGALAVTLESAPGQVTIAGRTVRALGYNGGTPGPTLRVRAGDTLSVSLRNGLTDPSNLHVHGLHVSPENNSDNMFVTVPAGESFDYQYDLPANHPPGVYWYHPHQHGFVTDQVFGGLFGAIIVEDPDPIPADRERLLVVSDITISSAGTVPAATSMEKMSGREGELVLVNGQLNPGMTARPGERERWRIVNASVSRYLRLRLDGQRMTLLGIDSGRFESARDVEEIVLAPGNRADLLVTGASGTSVLRTLPYDRGSSGGMMGGGFSPATDDVALATLTVAGETADEPAAIPRQPTPRDLRSTTVTARRELVFAMGMGGMGGGMMTPTINGRVFDPSRDDETVQFGSVEEWLLTNTSPLDHPLHLHVWPMQIVEQDGQAVETAIWQDVVNIRARSTTRVRIAFEDFSGRTVYHCHILDHEDAGMMGIIQAR
ncbi:multicopper oxidase family protein [Cryobacterium psychrophilum]|uniref:Multicopper oxidase family protein n=1 Tax=Cryobacterium psychrophilum TaxID=41988 RepID=A0A4Y8KTN6_9MICO|nr:multicopper oxidase family protein [Cryobacterium psychrophilum]TDW29756.1 FtsP/CotA-like multicopper oxidase with cupredoxin domain [Cryobacterium psychrophilum]TFD81858.1 multicopper oxidase family protein [Cryobacterium psychrophilum]